MIHRQCKLSTCQFNRGGFCDIMEYPSQCGRVKKYYPLMGIEIKED